MYTAEALKPILEAKTPTQLTPDRQLSKIRLAPSGQLVLAAGHDGRIHRWDLTADPPAVLPPVEGHHGWVQSLHWLPDGERVVSADTWGQLRCMKVTSGESTLIWEQAQAHDGWIVDLAVTADGSRAATCGHDGRVRVWQTDNGQRLWESAEHGTDVFSVTFSPDGTSLFSGDLQGRVLQWSASDGRRQQEFDATDLHISNRLQEVGGARVLMVSQDGKQLLVGGTKPKNGGNVQGEPTVRVYEIATQKALRTITLGAVGDVYITEMQELPDGDWLATISGNPGTGKVVLFRLDADQPVYETKKYANCHSLSWQATTRRLAVSGTNTGSNGNGRSLKNGEYLGNYSPIYLFTLPDLTSSPGTAPEATSKS